MKEIKEKVYELLKNTKCFEDVESILNSISAKEGGATIRGFILDYMEENYPEEFENWL